MKYKFKNVALEIDGTIEIPDGSICIRVNEQIDMGDGSFIMKNASWLEPITNSLEIDVTAQTCKPCGED